MRVSNADRGPFGRAASLAAVLAVSALALAATPPPAGAEETEAPPVSLLPSTGPSAFPEVQNPRDVKVQVQDLAALDPNATGVLDQPHGGLGTDMWAGSQMVVAQKATQLLPTASPSRVVRSLERRLLLSAAAVPAGKASGTPLIKLRADKLWALGDAEGVAALLKGVPNSAMTAELRRMEVDAAVLAGDNPTACNELPALRADNPQDAYPAKLQVYCQFVAGKGNEAGLGIDLLREQKTNDPAFFAAADALSGINPGKLDGFATASPLAIAMARNAKLALPESAAANAQPVLLRAIALNPQATPEARLAAAERAESLGLISVDTLRQVYEGITFKPDELGAPLVSAGGDKGARIRALLYRAALQEQAPNIRAQIIAKDLSLGEENGAVYAMTARVLAPLVINIPAQDPAFAAFSPMAARALFAAGQIQPAENWLGLARAQGLNNDSLAAAAAAQWPLGRLTQPSQDEALIAGATLAAWQKAQGNLKPEVAARRTAVLYSLLNAFGGKVPAEDWAALLDGPATITQPSPRPGLWMGLKFASEQLRLAETVSLGLASLGDQPLDQVDPIQLYRVIAALRLVGLDADARALAVEAAIANGV